jgi:hypothetical protein
MMGFRFFSVVMIFLIAFLFVQYHIQVDFLNQEDISEPKVMLDPNRYVHVLW